MTGNEAKHLNKLPAELDEAVRLAREDQRLSASTVGLFEIAAIALQKATAGMRADISRAEEDGGGK